MDFSAPVCLSVLAVNYCRGGLDFWGGSHLLSSRSRVVDPNCQASQFHRAGRRNLDFICWKLAGPSRKIAAQGEGGGMLPGMALTTHVFSECAFSECEGLCADWQRLGLPFFLRYL